jgi:hypothetical protein
MLYAAYFGSGPSIDVPSSPLLSTEQTDSQKESQMRNVTLNAAIATILSNKFGAAAAEMVEREPLDSPVDEYSTKSTKMFTSYKTFDPAEKKKKETRKRNKAAAASRKRNRK